MALLVVLVAAVAVVVLVMRAAAAAGDPRRAQRPRMPHPSQIQRQRPQRVVGPDDDPEFLRELQRRARRDDSPA